VCGAGEERARIALPIHPTISMRGGSSTRLCGGDDQRSAPFLRLPACPLVSFFVRRRSLRNFRCPLLRYFPIRTRAATKGNKLELLGPTLLSLALAVPAIIFHV
jgi:hypothetical protein